MTDTEPDAALQHAHSHLHPADAADDLSGGTESGTEPKGRPPGAAPGGAERTTEDDLVDDAAELTDNAGAAEDRVPGDGTVGSPPRHGDVDAMRTTERGRETAAARADTSDTTPTPTETHGG
jgi:hypothetical protein